MLMMASPKQRTLTTKNIMTVMIITVMTTMTITVMATIIIITATTVMISITENYILGLKQLFKEKFIIKKLYNVVSNSFLHFSLSESSSSAEEEGEDKLSIFLHEGQDGIPGSTLGSGSENEESETEEGSVPLGQSHLQHSDISVPVHSSRDAYSDSSVVGGGRKEHSDKKTKNSSEDDDKSWSAVTLEVNQHSAVNMVSENHHSYQDHQGHSNGQSQASPSSRPPNRDPPAGRRRHSSEKSLPVSFSNSGQRVTGGMAAAFLAAILFLLNAHHMYSM
jgi:hypothetical protein